MGIFPGTKKMVADASDRSFVTNRHVVAGNRQYGTGSLHLCLILKRLQNDSVSKNKRFGHLHMEQVRFIPEPALYTADPGMYLFYCSYTGCFIVSFNKQKKNDGQYFFYRT